MKKPLFYYAVRKAGPTCAKVRRQDAEQFDIAFITRASIGSGDALYDYIGTPFRGIGMDYASQRFFFHTIDWCDYDLLNAFGVPLLTEDFVNSSFILVRPQTIINENGSITTATPPLVGNDPEMVTELPGIKP